MVRTTADFRCSYSFNKQYAHLRETCLRSGIGNREHRIILSRVAGSTFLSRYYQVPPREGGIPQMGGFLKAANAHFIDTDRNRPPNSLAASILPLIAEARQSSS